MNMRRFAKPVAALLLALGVAAFGASTPSTAVAHSQVNTYDTGWG